jgi:hypothetical protein
VSHEPRIQQLQTALDALDARRQKDLADLRQELDRGVGRSDDFIKKEATALGEGLLSEKHERTRQVEDRSRELEARLRAIEERLGKLEEHLVSETRALRQASLEQHRQYADELRNWRDEVAKAIARDLAGLRAEKADRAVLAQLLSEVGDRISGEAAEPTRH